MEASQTNTLILFIPSIVAFLAVVISWRSLTIANRQMRAAVKIADKQITAPMREGWINKLRDLVAELISLSQRYYAADDSFTNEDYQRLVLLEAKIKLMLNPQEPPHQKLEKEIREIVGIKYKKEVDFLLFVMLRNQVENATRAVLKREWNRVKEPIQAKRSRSKSTG